MSNKSDKPKGFNRRDFLKTGALSSLFAGPAILNGCGSSKRATNRNGGSAKNIIFMVSDGMSTGTLTAADHMLKRQFDRESKWMQLYRENRATRSLMDMASRDSIVTGSGSAASSWGCGNRINNGMINMTPDEEPIKPILPICRDAGRATGLVTTTEVTHATPAGFSANVTERWNQEEIAKQYVESDFDLILGGGTQHFDSESREDGKDLFAEMESKGYRLIRHKDELQNFRGSSDRVLGTFNEGHLPFTTDHLNMDEYKNKIPTLSEMTEVALERLSGSEEGFILQVEGGRVDHGAHGNDISALIYDQIAFDDAIAKVVELAEDRDDTLVIITTDHGNANPGLNGIGSGYNDSNHKFDRIQKFRRTNTWLLSELDADSSTKDIKDKIYFATDIEIKEKEAELLSKSFDEEYEAVYRVRSAPRAVLAETLANYVAVNWVGTMHTADYVELASFGPGSEYLKERAFVKNTELFDLMVNTANVREYF